MIAYRIYTRSRFDFPSNTGSFRDVGYKTNLDDALALVKGYIRTYFNKKDVTLLEGREGIIYKAFDIGDPSCESIFIQQIEIT